MHYALHQLKETYNNLCSSNTHSITNPITTNRITTNRITTNHTPQSSNYGGALGNEENQPLTFTWSLRELQRGMGNDEYQKHLQVMRSMKKI